MMASAQCRRTPKGGRKVSRMYDLGPWIGHLFCSQLSFLYCGRPGDCLTTEPYWLSCRVVTSCSRCAATIFRITRSASFFLHAFSTRV